MPKRTVADSLRTERTTFTPAELRVAQALLADYPSAGLQTVNALAGVAGVSAPTVVRLVAKLGYRAYADLQTDLRAELSARTAGPVESYPTGRPDPTSLLGRTEQTLSTALAVTLRGVDPAELVRAVQLLTDPSRPVFTVGGRVSQPLAAYLGRFLSLLRRDVTVVGAEASARAIAALDVGRGATVVAYDYRRYDAGVVAFSREANRRGARLILFTDPYLSPLAPAATVLLTTVVEALPPFVTLTPAFALTEALVTGVLESLGAAGRRRLARFDDLAGSS